MTIAATWFGTGLSPWAPGTMGTLGAIPFYLALSQLPLWLYGVTAAAFAALSCWVSGHGERVFGERDPGKIVIDEVAGYLVTMTAVPCTWKTVLAGFVLFRFFDICKIPPARYFDRQMKNGFGVVLDDIVAGIYSCVALHLLKGFL
jgi:phosphatidylglycerophosphatase A